MIKIIHPVGGAIAPLTIATFWLSTASPSWWVARDRTTSGAHAVGVTDRLWPTLGLQDHINWGLPDGVYCECRRAYGL
jgi:hypothetical protein